MSGVSVPSAIRSRFALTVNLENLDYISRLTRVRGTLRPTFTFSPVGPAYTYPNGHASGAFKTPSLVPVTFTAAYLTDGDPSVNAVHYEWDFGDGHVATGTSVTHTFAALIPNLRVSLCITDDLGIRRCVGRNLVLYEEFSILATPGVIIL